MKFIYLIVSTLIFTSTILASNTKSDISAISTTKWLVENQTNAKLVIIDLRPTADYKKGHIKNAVSIPALESLFDTKFLMPKLNYLKKVLSKAGIDHNSLVLAYDDGSFIWSARFYWILEVLGHTNVSILNVGYGNWGINKVVTSTKNYTPKPKNFIPRVDSTKVKTKLSTLMAIGNQTIIDGRKKPAYQGKESTAKRFGHIPTAKSYACTNNYEVAKNGNKMRDLKDLQKVYKDLPKDKEIILYCDGGAEAALNYIVLQELGYKASVYDGSWLEWGNDSSVPVENPSAK